MLKKEVALHNGRRTIQWHHILWKLYGEGRLHHQSTESAVWTSNVWDLSIWKSFRFRQDWMCCLQVRRWVCWQAVTVRIIGQDVVFKKKPHLPWVVVTPHITNLLKGCDLGLWIYDIFESNHMYILLWQAGEIHFAHAVLSGGDGGWNFFFYYVPSLRPHTVASGASPSLRTLPILTGIVCSQNCYIGAPRIFSWRLKIGQICEFFKTEDLKIQFLKFEDLQTVLFSHFLPQISDA